MLEGTLLGLAAAKFGRVGSDDLPHVGSQGNIRRAEIDDSQICLCRTGLYRITGKRIILRPGRGRAISQHPRSGR